VLTLVLLPGTDGTGELFQDFINALDKTQKTIVLNYPVENAFSYELLEDFVKQSIPTTEPYVILGESFSGPIATALASKKDENLKGLILCCSFTQNPRPECSKLSALVRILPVQRAPTCILRYISFGRFSTPKLISALTEAIAKVSPSTIRNRLISVLKVNYSGKLLHIEVPILYLRATEDRIVPKKASEIIANIKPSVQIIEIAGPHFLLQASPKKAAIAVTAFLSKVQASL